jgi:hypothetical protein
MNLFGTVSSTPRSTATSSNSEKNNRRQEAGQTRSRPKAVEICFPQVVREHVQTR